MRNMPGMLFFATCLLIGIVHADDREQEGRKRTDKSRDRAKTIVYVARNSPASALAGTLAQFLEESDGRVAMDSISNVLLIDTTPENQERVLAVLQQLDRTPKTLRIQLHLLRARGEALAELDTASLSGRTDHVLKTIKTLESTKRVYVANRLELTAIENQPAMLQVGETVSMVAGSTSIPGRGSASNFRAIDVGTLFKVEARVSGESDIVMEADFEKSEVTPTTADSDEQPRRSPSGVTRLTHQTTSRIRDRHSLLVATLVSQSPDGIGEAYLILSASIDSEDDSKQGTTFRAFSKKPATIDAALAQNEATLAELGGKLEYFRKLVDKYDQNKDKALDSDERSKMSKDCSAADTDMDGLVTFVELARWVMKR